MGLFGKLFEKKECAICGDEIGLFGEPKARRRQHVQSVRGEALPWFDERRHSTVSQIEDQLEYREANKTEVAAFHTTPRSARASKC